MLFVGAGGVSAWGVSGGMKAVCEKDAEKPGDRMSTCRRQNENVQA